EDFPVATAAAREVLCLPIYPEMTNEEVETVCAGVREFFQESRMRGLAPHAT
ncbi:MAG TPA: DegT/DnrJ/EryC1/StrS family aminotransferase, partial [Thermoanaerobaculia bacterium]